MMPNRMAAHGARMGAVVALSMMILAPVAHAQSNPPIDSDLVRPGAPATSAPASSPPAPAYAPSATGAPYAPAAQPTPMSATSVPPADGTTYHQDDLIGAAEGVFGKGAKGLAQLIQDILKKQGEPNAYIIGREAGGAFALGLRYGSGTLYHRVEGQRPAYWAGPSIGLMPGPMRPTLSCWSITCTTPRTSITALARARGRPIWWAVSTFPMCGAGISC